MKNDRIEQTGFQTSKEELRQQELKTRETADRERNQRTNTVDETWKKNDLPRLRRSRNNNSKGQRTVAMTMYCTSCFLLPVS